MTRKRHPKVLAAIGDTHAGSSVAVCPPRITLDDGGSYEASKPQQWLRQCYGDFWGIVDEERRKADAELWTLINGDLTEGDHHGTTQILSGNPTAQAAVVDALMKPILDLNPDRMYFTRGTEAHVGKSACYEERVAKGLKKDKWNVIADEETGNFSHWHLKINLDGVRIDAAHHGRVGTRPWTKPNASANLAAEIFYEHAKIDFLANRMPSAPHIALRSHMHQYVDTYDQHPTRVIQMPAWQLKTAFTHRIDTSGKLADIGGVIITVRDGIPIVRPVLFRPRQVRER
jgi:hypothetical protein